MLGGHGIIWGVLVHVGVSWYMSGCLGTCRGVLVLYVILEVYKTWVNVCMWHRSA